MKLLLLPISLLSRLLNGLLQLGDNVRHQAGLFFTSSTTHTGVRWVLYGCLAWVGFSIFLVYGWPYLSVLNTGETAQKFTEAHQRSKAISSWDSQGRFLGFLPSAISEPDFRDFKYENCYTVDDKEYCGDHKTMWVNDVPEPFWQCLTYHEDRHSGKISGNPHGVDIRGMIKIPISAITTTIRKRSPSLGPGGSTLSMQLSRSMQLKSPGDAFFPKIKRKFGEWYNATIISRATNAPNSAEWRRWNGMHLPMSQAPGGTVYGVEANAIILFGKRASELSVAQQYTLASMVKFNPKRDGHSPQWRQTTYGTIKGSRDEINLYTYPERCEPPARYNGAAPQKGRARICAEQLLDGAERDAVISELQEMCAWDVRPHVPSEFEPIYQQRKDDSEWMTEWHLSDLAATPQRISAYLSPKIQSAMLAELRDFSGILPRDSFAEVETTLDIARNDVFGRDVEKALRDLEQSKRSGINKSSYTFSADPTEKKRIYASVAIADDQGRVLRLYENNELNQYTGTIYARAKYPGKRGRIVRGEFNPDRVVREIASTGKILHALALGEAGEDTARTAYAPNMSAAYIYARSKNIELTRRVKKVVGNERLESLLEASSYGTIDAHLATELTHRITLGRVGASPRQVQAVTAAAIDFIQGGTGRGIMPSLIERYRIYDDGKAVWTKSPMQLVSRKSNLPLEIDLGLSGSERGRKFVHDVLRAPACHPKGTVRRVLGSWCSRTDLDVFIVKTGTRGKNEDGSGRLDNYEWWITGGVAYDTGQTYTWVVSLGTGSPKNSFSSQTASAAAPIAKLLLDEIDKLYAEDIERGQIGK